jgi:hypothetical protein
MCALMAVLSIVREASMAYVRGVETGIVRRGGLYDQGPDSEEEGAPAGCHNDTAPWPTTSIAVTSCANFQAGSQ